MIVVDPEAALELLEARDYYEGQRPTLGGVFTLVAQRTLDGIEANPDRFPVHAFATTAGVRRALFLRPPRFPYAFAYMIHPNGYPYVLAVEHLRREPMYWATRLRRFPP
jgi:hypothetical protein